MARIITPDFSKSQGSFLDTPGTFNVVRGLRVKYSDRLKKYLDERRDKDILISAYKPHGHMSVAEEHVRTIDEETADVLIAEGAPYVLGEMGRVLISNTWIPDHKNAVIELDLSNWLGVKSIAARGLKRQDLLGYFAPILQKTD